MASALYQSIELLSREKGIDPEIVVGAVEDAIALATRKFYKTQETMRGELDRESGEIRAYVYKTVVDAEEQVEDPENQLTLDAVLDDMISRCRELDLRAVGSERKLVMDFTVLLTAKTMHALFGPSRRKWIAL